MSWRKAWGEASTPASAGVALDDVPDRLGGDAVARPRRAGRAPAGVVAQEEGGVAVGAGVQVGPHGGQGLVGEEDDALLFPLAGDQGLAGSRPGRRPG